MTYYIFNYYTFRIIITFIIIAVIILTYKLLINKIPRHVNRIIILILSVLSIAIWIFPFEKDFIKFDTVEKAFKYNFPTGNIIKKYLYDNNSYILYTNGKYYDLIKYRKKDNKWLIENTFMSSSNQNEVRNFKEYTIFINNINDVNSIVSVIYMEKIGNKKIVTDSLLSNFEIINFSSSGSVTMYANITIVTKKIKNDYTLTIDGQKYKPLK